MVLQHKCHEAQPTASLAQGHGKVSSHELQVWVVIIKQKHHL